LAFREVGEQRRRRRQSVCDLVPAGRSRVLARGGSPARRQPPPLHSRPGLGGRRRRRRRRQSFICSCHRRDSRRDGCGCTAAPAVSGKADRGRRAGLLRLESLLLRAPPPPPHIPTPPSDAWTAGPGCSTPALVLLKEARTSFCSPPVKPFMGYS
jgi:hypothetical protein